MNTWKLQYHRFDPEKENLREALCTLGNGYIGVRGAAPETVATRVHYPGTYIAGVYNALTTDIAGRGIVNEDFVNCPNWLMLNYRIDDGPWFNRLQVKILSWKVELNMREGIMLRRLRWQDDEGRITRVESQRLVSMADPHLCALQCIITPENYDGNLTIRSGIDGQMINAGVDRYKQLNSKHLRPEAHGAFKPDGVFLTMKTVQSGIEITEAQRTLVYDDQRRVQSQVRVLLHGRERIIQQFTVPARRGKPATIEKIVGIYTSRDQGVADHARLAQESAAAVESYEHLYKPHKAKWRALWKRFDIEIEGDDFIQQVLRLHAFHLLQVASTYNADIDAGLPARGLHGEAYRGHIFWDELYTFPFYNLRAPEITRALLMYRYRRLGAAKELARQHGYRGAMYPWQSASTGEETTQVIHLNPMSGTWGPDYSSLQRHVSIAIAYNVWTYYFVSGDRDFLDRYGAEMLVEISHFWSSMTRNNTKTGRYEIDGVMGPDEFHEKYPGAKKGGLKNNAYTNVMVTWVIARTLQVLDLLSPENRNALLIKTEVSQKELARWKDIVYKMTVPIDKDGLIHQFDGYKDLKELNWEEYRAKYDNIHRIDRILKAEGLSPDSYKVSKQADTLMLFYILNFQELQQLFHQLGYRFDKKLMLKNYNYYVQRTSHGSTLSRVVHGFIAERLGREEEAMSFFRDAMKSDIHDSQGGTTQEGIHVGVMGGTVHLFLRSFAGLYLSEDQIQLRPDLPPGWSRVRFHVRYKNVWFDITVRPEDVKILAEPVDDNSLVAPQQIPIVIDKKLYQLRSKKTETIRYKP